MAALRLIFMGSAELSCASLRALLETPDFVVAAVVTQPDKPKGRELKLRASPVKELALGANLLVLQPARARDDSFVAELRALEPDLIAVAAYGQILPPAILDLPRYGCLNVHTSLLPRHRGAAPIQRAILSGDRLTGVTIMKMDAGLDTGGILAQEETLIDACDDSGTLHDRLATMGARLLLRTIPEYVSGQLTPRAQPAEGVTYAAKLRKDDGRIDWHQPAESIWNQVRGLVPWPGAFTLLPGSALRRSLKIWKAEMVHTGGPPGEILAVDKSGPVVGCGRGALRLLVLQREGGRPMDAQQFLAGHAMKTGDQLGD
jgi:methionyl-tRNA formyltransferase